MSREVVVVSGVRTAIGTYGGSLKDIPPTELAALVVREALARAKGRARIDGRRVSDTSSGRRASRGQWLAMALAPGQVLRQAGAITDPLFRALLSGAPAPGWGGPALALGAFLLLALAPRLGLQARVAQAAR